MIEDDKFLISGALVDYQPKHAFLVFFLDKKTQKFTATAQEEPKYTEKHEAQKISGLCEISDYQWFQLIVVEPSFFTE